MAWELSFGDMRLTETGIWQLFVHPFAKTPFPRPRDALGFVSGK
jgi:hypothetical protein